MLTFSEFESPKLLPLLLLVDSELVTFRTHFTLWIFFAFQGSSKHVCLVEYALRTWAGEVFPPFMVPGSLHCAKDGFRMWQLYPPSLNVPTVSPETSPFNLLNFWLPKQNAWSLSLLSKDFRLNSSMTKRRPQWSTRNYKATECFFFRSPLVQSQSSFLNCPAFYDSLCFLQFSAHALQS